MNKVVHREISKKVEEMTEDIIKTRRHFHTYLVLSGKERQTIIYVAENLKALGLSVQTNIGGYGVVGLLNAVKPGATIALGIAETLLSFIFEIMNRKIVN